MAPSTLQGRCGTSPRGTEGPRPASRRRSRVARVGLGFGLGLALALLGTGCTVERRAPPRLASGATDSGMGATLRVPAPPGLRDSLALADTGRVGQPIPLRLWAGGSGAIACNRPDGLTLSWDVEATLVVQAWFRIPGRDMACTMDFRDYAFDTTVVFPRAGTWTVIQPRGGEGPPVRRVVRVRAP